MRNGSPVKLVTYAWSSDLPSTHCGKGIQIRHALLQLISRPSAMISTYISS